MKKFVTIVMALLLVSTMLFAANVKSTVLKTTTATEKLNKVIEPTVTVVLPNKTIVNTNMESVPSIPADQLKKMAFNSDIIKLTKSANRYRKVRGTKGILADKLNQTSKAGKLAAENEFKIFVENQYNPAAQEYLKLATEYKDRYGAAQYQKIAEENGFSGLFEMLQDSLFPKRY